LKIRKDMDNNTKALIIGGIVAVLLVGGLWVLSNTELFSGTENPSQNNGTILQNNKEKGTLVLSITDAAVDMGTISAVSMTIDKVYVHSKAQGWVTVLKAPQSFSLLTLKSSGRAALLAKIDIAADTYDQAWLHISNVTITEAGKVKEALLPSNDFKMEGSIKVENNTNSIAKFDILADQSIHKTSKGEFVFAPVIKFESRINATISFDSNNFVTISDGNLVSSTTAGMNVDGQVKTNFQLDPKKELEIKNGVIEIK